MAHHVIRLRGPWEYRPSASGSRPAETDGLPPPGRVAYHRRFGRPTGLGSADRVELVIDRVDALGSVQLNGESLGEIPAGGQAWRCDVTTRLTRRNELIVEVELPHVSDDRPPVRRPGREGLPGGLLDEVRLEIFSV